MVVEGQILLSPTTFVLGDGDGSSAGVRTWGRVLHGSWDPVFLAGGRFF